MTVVNASTAEEARIRELAESCANAVRAKDVDAVVSFYDHDLLLYDLPPPLAHRGIDAYRKSLQEWFATFEGRVGFEVRDLGISASGSVAFAHSLNRITGRRTNGDETDVWVRATTCWRKAGGTWRIAHEHVSVPFHMDGSEKAALDLKP
jgi:ketosteroid isomerase-like protein